MPSHDDDPNVLLAALILSTPMLIVLALGIYWLVMVALTLVAVCVMRAELREFAVARPAAAKFDCAEHRRPHQGQHHGARVPLGTICDWEQLLDICNGWQACA